MAIVKDSALLLLFTAVFGLLMSAPVGLSQPAPSTAVPASGTAVCSTKEKALTAGLKRIWRFNPKVPDVCRGDLNLKLKNGTFLVLSDRPIDDPSTVGYRFEAYDGGVGFYYVAEKFYEGEGMVAVSEATGEQFQMLPGVPKLSPDHKRLLATNWDLESGYSRNGAEIWRLTPKGLQLEFSIEPEDWGPVGARWISATQVQFTEESAPSLDEKPPRTQVAFLKFGQGKWTLTTEPKKSRH